MPEKPASKDGWIAPAAAIGGALIGAAATIAAAFIANKAGAINISLSPAAAPTVTVTVTASTTSSSPTATATTASSSGVAGIKCPADNNCTTYELTAAYATGGRAGISVVGGQVDLNGDGDDFLYQASATGAPEFVLNNAPAFSLNVTAENASMQQCITATTEAPDPEPITKFYKGLLFCAQPPGAQGVALMEVTEPLDSSNTLHLREIYWPNQ